MASYFNRLPAELKEEILRKALVERFAIVDPSTNNQYGRLPKVICGAPNIQPFLGHSTSTKRNSSEGAIATIRGESLDEPHTANRTVSPDGVFCVGINPAVLQVNRECYKIGHPLLYDENVFLFTSQQSLEYFVRKEPYACTQIKKVTLSGQMNQVIGGTEQILPTAAQLNQMQWHYRWWTGAFPAPYQAVLINAHPPNSDPAQVLSRFPLVCRSGSFPMMVDTNPNKVDHAFNNPFRSLQYLRLHLHGWQDREVMHYQSMLDCLRGMPQQISIGRSQLVEPRRLIKGANPLQWARCLALSGWQVKTVHVTGLELLNDPEYVRRMEDALRSDSDEDDDDE